MNYLVPHSFLSLVLWIFFFIPKGRWKSCSRWIISIFIILLLRSKKYRFLFSLFWNISVLNFDIFYVGLFFLPNYVLVRLINYSQGVVEKFDNYYRIRTENNGPGVYYAIQCSSKILTSTQNPLFIKIHTAHFYTFFVMPTLKII